MKVVWIFIILIILIFISFLTNKENFTNNENICYSYLNSKDCNNDSKCFYWNYCLSEKDPSCVYAITEQQCYDANCKWGGCFPKNRPL